MIMEKYQAGQLRWVVHIIGFPTNITDDLMWNMNLMAEFFRYLMNVKMWQRLIWLQMNLKIG